MERVEIQKLVLATIAVPGLLAIAAIAPNTLQLFSFLTRRHRRYRSPALIRATLSRLQQRGFIAFESHHGARVARITPAGKTELLKYQLREKSIASKSWDKKWRIIAFDIREYKRSARDSIRSDLTIFGFQRLQNSVWVYPHPCEDIITLLKTNHHIGNELLYITADSIENDRWLREHFGLM